MLLILLPNGPADIFRGSCAQKGWKMGSFIYVTFSLCIFMLCIGWHFFLLRSVTFTFWNSLRIYVIKMYRYETLTLSDATVCFSYVHIYCVATVHFVAISSRRLFYPTATVLKGDLCVLLIAACSSAKNTPRSMVPGQDSNRGRVLAGRLAKQWATPPPKCYCTYCI